MLTALLSFYDEQPAHLHRMIASLPLAGVTHLAAYDGRYQLFPGKHTNSHPDQIEAIQRACDTAQIRLTLKQPDQPWQGNEIEKRTALFDLGSTVTDPESWWLVMDGDEEILSAPDDLETQLDSVFDVAEITYKEPGKPAVTFPKLFRAIPGLHVRVNHYTYTTPDGRNLWGNAHTMRLQPRIPIHDLVVHHHTKSRTPERRVQRVNYYQRRDALGIEQHHTVM